MSLLKNLIKINYLLIFFIINEIKIIKKKFLYFSKYYLAEVNCFFFIKKFFYKNKSYFKIENFNKYIIVNKNIWKDNNKNFSKKKILVESFINHPIYTIANCLIGIKLAEFHKLECLGVIRSGDLYAEEIMRSFNIRKVLKINEGNFFLRLYFFLKSIKIFSYIKSIKSLIKYKIKKIEIGKSTYEQFIRFSQQPYKNDINKHLYKNLMDALIYNNQAKKIFNKDNIKYYIQSETQYIPHRIFFQNALLNNIQIFSRSGVNDISIKKYETFQDRNINRLKLSKKLFHNFYNKKKYEILKKINPLIRKKFKEKKFGLEVYQLFENKISKCSEFRSKKEICDYFGWLEEKPIVIILAHNLTDGNFINQWNLFLDDEEWIVETIKKIKLINNVNWIIKPHPSENLIKNESKKIEFILKKLCKHERHIKIFPSNYNLNNSVKFMSSAITAHGSAGYEYPSLGVPTIVTGDSFYTNLGFTIEPKTKDEYFKVLNQLSKPRALNKVKINKARIFWYLYNILTKVNVPIIPFFDITAEYNKKRFWKKTLTILKSNKNLLGNFFTSFDNQLKNNNLDLVNISELKKIK